ncbi:hypothetical protein GA0070216_107238 [Micromonospora matsumotoense]|uniref:4-amino-4-deoxy-L-arabinose transferase n=1 Tax=Micromonospora matsumotoense TaxID=121616 RepID=A0A1C4YWQ8_9ACTN|nr:DUF6077 domain-containing protein [Micromonospora matsumotoense]SCF25076.1 hypothetical protein GA0070216_107238 [Micromonospora matsumotoense]
MTEVEVTVGAPAPAHRGEQPPSDPGLLRRLDALASAVPVLLTDAAVVGFALWTLLYHLNLALDLRPSVVFAVWVLTLPIAAYGGWRVGRRRRNARLTGDGKPAEAASEPSTEAGWAALFRRYGLPIGAGVGAALLAALGTGSLTWWLAVVLGLVAIVSAWASFRVRGDSAGPAPTGTTSIQTLVVTLAALAAAVFSTFIARVSLDDVFYVGKSVWVAERDQIPYRDFLFTEGVLPAGSANPPVPSFEVFIGALARVLHIHAASTTWYVVLPLLAVFAVFALWRLVQRWAPRRPLLVFGVALTYIVLVAGYPDVLNTYHLPRLTQGKSVFVHALIPLAWVYLTDYLETRSRRALVLLGLLSVAAVGLTTTAVILLPLLAVAAVTMLVLARRWRDAALCFAAASTYPLLVGVGARLATGGLEEAVATYIELRPLRTIYELTLWLGVLGVIAGIAMWCAPILLRRGVPRTLVAGAVLAVTLLLIPGVAATVGNLSGLTAVLWRVPWIVPVPALVGMLAVIRLPRWDAMNRVLVFGLPTALVLAFATLGLPMWTANVLQAEPSWRMPETRKDVAFWITRLDRPSGLVLAPTPVMRALPQVTTRVRVVMARDLYLTDYDMASQFSRDRLLLGKFADGTEAVPVSDVQGAMGRVGVSVVCVWKSNRAVADAAPALGIERFASRKSPGGMYCYRTSGPVTPADGP